MKKRSFSFVEHILPSHGLLSLQNPNLIPLSNTAPPLTIHGAEYVVELISFTPFLLLIYNEFIFEFALE